MDGGEVKVEQVETLDGEVVVGEAELEDVDEGLTADDDETLTNADFGGSDEAVVTYEEQIVEALPALARLGATALTRGATVGMRFGVRASLRLARAMVDPEAATDLVNGVGNGMRSRARDFLGITELDERVQVLTPVGHRFAPSPSRAVVRAEPDTVSPERALRAQGAELLRQSADVATEDGLHPAFGRILGELAPDEGRILRLLCHEGPQAAVDVRTASLIGAGSQLVAQNLNMVDMQAGVRHGDHLEAYLGNLQRLGLVCFSDEPLEDPMAYQVLEAQPHVLDAIKRTSRAKTIQRSLRLTAFGSEFCGVSFPAELDEVKELTAPPSTDPL